MFMRRRRRRRRRRKRRRLSVGPVHVLNIPLPEVSVRSHRRLPLLPAPRARLHGTAPAPPDRRVIQNKH